MSCAELIGTLHNLNMPARRTATDTAADIFNTRSVV